MAWVLAWAGLAACGSSAPQAAPAGRTVLEYMGEAPPTSTPVVFAPDFVSGVAGRNAAVITFAPDGKTAFFYSEQYPHSSTLFTEYRDGAWTTPALADFSRTRATTEPSFSPDGSRLYFATDSSAGAVGGYDLVYVERVGASWSTTTEPVNVGAPVNTAGDEFHPCLVADGTLYFTGATGAVMRSRYVDGAYQAPEALPAPINVDTGLPSWGDPYVPPDESYLLFKSNRAGGFGDFDLYLSYRGANDAWTEPTNLGDLINTSAAEFSGDVTPDGQYMTFGRDGSIYWVKADFITPP